MRFSRPEQAKGTSIERQSHFAEQYALEHGFELDKSLTMMDKGLSAFHGVHKKKGAFGQFLAAVTAGKVKSGSVLVVESLDRLSREDPLIAQSALSDLILSGITVVTAADNQVYSREEIQQNPFKLIMSLVVMIRANEESETKQRRSNAFLKSALNQYQTNGKVRRLSWLDFRYVLV
ncbi:recombinase family protein [Vibrio lentus]